MKTGVREPIAAGTLYAADSQELRSEIDQAINQADTEFTSPKLLVVPSCGLANAPQVAGNAMIMLESERDFVDRVVLVSDYRPRFEDRPMAGIALPRSIAFRTPLGDLLLDRQSIDPLEAHPSVVLDDRPFGRDMAIEAQLPPLQRLLGAVRIVPVLVGDVAPAALVDVLERLWGERNTLVVVCTDFGGGEDADVVAEAGDVARNAFTRSQAKAFASSAATSVRSLIATMTILGRRSMGLLELANDVVVDPLGGAGQLVDAAAFAAWESTDMALADVDANHLRALAQAAVELTVLGGRVDGSDMGRIPPALAARRATVVTLRLDGSTRGSAGTIEADRPLAGSVIRNAAAACADPRLPSVQPTELRDLEMSISLISPIERIFPHSWEDLDSMLTAGRHGVLVMGPGGRAAQLPAMWARFPTAASFLDAVGQKAGVDRSHSVGAAAWYRFHTLDY